MKGDKSSVSLLPGEALERRSGEGEKLSIGVDAPLDTL